MKLLLELSSADLKRAADIKDKITHLGKELASVLGISVSTADEIPAPKKKSKMSAAARAKIASAQKARWAKVKGAKPAKVAKKKSGMSAAGRARIAAAQKVRWAKVKAAKAA